jgi:hypothetical protein
MASISQATNTMTPSSDGVELQKLLAGMLADMTALAAQFNQLRTDYNANATIGTDTTATAVTLTTTA